MEKCFIIIPLTNPCDEIERENEICSLCKTAGAEVLACEKCKITRVNPATFLGKGKLEEFKNYCEAAEIEIVVFDGELTPSQTLNMSDALGGVKVVDRTTLILDIFAASAKSTEGKIQVELAQLKYIYPRLKGKGAALSRLGGGIGTRGPGESKLETDRRHIRRRIDFLEKQLEQTEKRRNLQRDRRERQGVLTVALVGYTNTGKSTLLNALTGSDVLSEDKLFATLDPTMRKLDLGKYTVVLADTVGFIKDIPTALVEAFKSTLETAVSADLDLIVCDAQGDFLTQKATTEAMLDELGATAPRLLVMNKCENLTDFSVYPANATFVSAKFDKGLDGLLAKIRSFFEDRFTELEFTAPYGELAKIMQAKKYCEFFNLEYLDEKLEVTVLIKNENREKVAKIISEYI